MGLSEKVLEKTYKELMELHQRCCKTYLVQIGMRYSIQVKFFVLYRRYIDTDNIQDYFNIPINLFAQALVKDTLYKFFKVKHHVHGFSKKSVHRKK